MTADDTHIIRIGRAFPGRQVWTSIIIALAIIIVFTVLSFVWRRPEQIPLLLLFLLIPGIVIPSSIALNHYAEIDQKTWLIRVNGGAPRPLAHLVFGSTGVHRGICTVTLGYSEHRRDQFSVSSNTPFGNPRIEREWVRYLLPYTGLPPVSDPQRPRYETMDDVRAFAHEWLK